MPRRNKSPGGKVVYERRSVALRTEQWAALEKLAEVLQVHARSGSRFGKPSWRTMLAMLAEQSERIVAAWMREDAARRGDE